MYKSYQHLIFGHPLYLLVMDEMVIGCTFSFEKHRKALRTLSCPPQSRTGSLAPLPDHFQAPLTNYLNGRATSLDWPRGDLLLRQGSRFQRAVWQQIAAIPYGATRCYGKIAEQLGGYKYARAVGGACNTNPLALLIPCHRVVAKNGVGGFAADTGIKEKLLLLEAKTLRAGA